MQIQYLEAKKKSHPYIECLRIKSMTLFAPKYLLYDMPHLAEELQKDGYTVQKSEFTLPIEEASFNELDLSYYDGDYFELFIFNGLAVKAGAGPMEVFCEEDMTLEDIIDHWHIDEDDVDESKIEVICKIPRDRLSDLAIRVDRMEYAVWEYYEKLPGETIEAEDRLDNISFLCKCLGNGRDQNDLLDNAKEMVQSCISEFAELLQESDGKNAYYQKSIGELNELLVTIEELRNECNDIAAELAAGPSESEASPHIKMF